MKTRTKWTWRLLSILILALAVGSYLTWSQTASTTSSVRIAEEKQGVAPVTLIQNSQVQNRATAPSLTGPCASYYPLYYLGPILEGPDRLAMGGPLTFGDRSEFSQNYMLDTLSTMERQSADLRLLVDAQDSLSLQRRFCGANEEENIEKIWVPAWAVYILNPGESKRAIGIGNLATLVMEAQTPEGEWRPIEAPLLFSCAEELKRVLLPGGYMAISKAPIYQGTHRTLLRIRLGDAVSNPFQGQINPAQWGAIGNWRHCDPRYLETPGTTPW